MKTPIPADAKRFRMRIIPGVIFLIGALMLGYFIGMVSVLVMYGFHLPWMGLFRVILISIPVALAFDFVAAWLISLSLPAYISSSGVHGHSFWCMRQFLNWTDIKEAKPFKFCTLTYVRLYSANDSKVMWLPLFQKPSPEFQNEIRKFAPPHSPILNQLG